MLLASGISRCGERPFGSGGPAGEPHWAIRWQGGPCPNSGDSGVECLGELRGVEAAGIGKFPAIPPTDHEAGGGGVECDGFFPLPRPAAIASGDDEDAFWVFRRVVVSFERAAGELQRQHLGRLAGVVARHHQVIEKPQDRR